MPIRMRRKTAPRRKAPKRAKRKNKLAIYKPVFGPRGRLPPVMKCSFLFNQFGNLTAAASSSVNSVLKLNSLYDPDHSNDFNNLQPVGYDQLISTSMYRSYRVDSWDLEYTISNRGANPLLVYSGKGEPSTTFGDTREELLARSGTIQRRLGSVNGSGSSIKIRHRGSPRAFHSTVDTNNSNMAGVYSSSPTALIYQNLLIYDPDLAAISVDVTVKLIQHATLQDLHTLESA